MIRQRQEGDYTTREEDYTTRRGDYTTVRTAIIGYPTQPPLRNQKAVISKQEVNYCLSLRVCSENSIHALFDTS